MNNQTNDQYNLWRHLAADFRTAAAHHRLLLAVGVLLCLAQFARLFFGVDMTDESYYFTHALRMAQGDGLFTDIWDTTQTQGIVLLPFIALYRLVFGTDGLILWNRILYYGLMLLTGAWLYEVLRTQASRRWAAITALCLFTFAPFSLYTLSYNNLTYSLCILGCALFWGGLQARSAGRLARGNGRLIVAGIVHALVAAAYPTQGITLALLYVMLFFLARSRYRAQALRSMVAYTVGLGAVAAGLLVYIALGCGLPAVLTSLRQMSASPASNTNLSLSNQLASVWDVCTRVVPTSTKRALVLLGVSVCALAPWIGRRVDPLLKRVSGKRRAWVDIALAACALGATVVFRNLAPLGVGLALIVSLRFGRYRAWLTVGGIALWMGYSAVLYMRFERPTIAVCELIFAYAIPMPWLLISLRGEQRKALSTLFWLLAVPSLFMTAVVSLSSGGGFYQGRYELIGVSLWNVLAICMLAMDAPIPPLGAKLRLANAEPLARAGGVLVAVTLLLTQYFCVFGDTPIHTYGAFVTKGAGAGLLTSPQRAAQLNAMADDVRATPGDSILCLEAFPYGYGLDDTKRAFTPSTWVCSTFSREAYTPNIYWTNFPEYCQMRGDMPDVVLYWRPDTYAGVANMKYELHRMLNEEYTLTVQRDMYRIYVRAR